MRLPRVQFTIRRLMLVVACVGVLSAWLRMPGAGALTAAAIFIIMPTCLALFAHIILARPGYRGLVATSVAAAWPALLLWVIHAAWVIAFGFLGHRPGPRDDGPVIDVLGDTVMLMWILSILSPVACLLLALAPDMDRMAVGGHTGLRAVPLLLMPLVWLSVLAFMRWDPLGAVVWFVD